MRLNCQANINKYLPGDCKTQCIEQGTVECAAPLCQRMFQRTLGFQQTTAGQRAPMAVHNSVPAQSLLDRALGLRMHLHLSRLPSVSLTWTPCSEPSKCLFSDLLYSKEQNVPSKTVLLTNGDSHRLKFRNVQEMVGAKRQVAMVTFFCGSDGDRGQLSSFVWLILSSLLPGYSTNKKTRWRGGGLFTSSLERKHTSWKKEKTKNKTPLKF